MIYFFFAAEVLAFLQVFPGLLGVVEVPTQYSRSWPLKKLMPAQGPPHMGTILVPRARGTPVKTKQKWGAHSVRADNLVLALQLRTIPSFKRADNDEKGLEQTRKAKSTLSEQWENAEADHRQRIQTDSEVQATPPGPTSAAGRGRIHVGTWSHHAAGRGQVPLGMMFHLFACASPSSARKPAPTNHDPSNTQPDRNHGPKGRTSNSHCPRAGPQHGVRHCVAHPRL